MLASPRPQPAASSIRKKLLFLTRIIPSPKTELTFSSPFELLIACILSAQSEDRQVNKVTRKLFAKANTPATIMALGSSKLQEEIRTLGLFRKKAIYIVSCAQILLSQHAGQVPNDKQQLMSLPGVGEKTAHVMMNTLYSAPVIGVDTHVLRLAKRLGWSTSKTRAGVSQDLARIIPAEFLTTAHNLLVLHGRYTCRAVSPKCGSCNMPACPSRKAKSLT